MITLDKEEFRVKLGEINSLVEKQDYKGAMSVVDSIDWRRVKNVRTLCVVGEIYAANKRYEDSKDIFLLAYHRAPIGKNILYRLIEVSLKMGEIDEAKDYYEEYLEVAPNDNTQYILKYKIYKAQGASDESLIRILEDYKEKEFTERWSYELARLYFSTGDQEKFLDLCNEMVLWFSDGKYVAKVLELKRQISPLTSTEKEIYDQHFDLHLGESGSGSKMKVSPEKRKKKSASISEEDAPSIGSVAIDEKDINNAESLQEKISKGIRDILGGKKKEPSVEEENEEEKDNARPKKVIRDVSSEEEEEEEEDEDSVPELEPEGERSRDNTKDLSGKMNIPSLNIPDKMKTIQNKTKLNKVAREFDEEELEKHSEQEEVLSEEEDSGEFNLEDTILAAATAQGIEIPDNPEKDSEKENSEEEDSAEGDFEEKDSEDDSDDDSEEMNSEEADSEEEDSEKENFGTTDSVVEEPEEKVQVREKDKYEIPSLEEEEFLSEEVLREAEEEFLNGPSSGKASSADPKDKKLSKQSRASEPDAGESRGQKNKKANLYSLQKEIEKMAEDDEEDFEDEKPSPKRSSSKKSSDSRTKSIFSNEEEEDYEDFISSSREKYFPDEDDQEELSEEEELERFIDSRDPRKMNPQNLIPREEVLTDEEIKLFTYFVKVPGMKEQLIDTLCDVQMAAADKTSRSGNIVVMGGRETGKTRLISSLIPAICMELNLPASKVAYVFADQINDKDISRIVNKLSGGFLVIEDANQLSARAAEQLDKAMEFRTDGLTVIVEDEKISMRKFMARYPKLAKKFSSVINIPVFTNDELVNFARVYTKENGYIIDQMGMLALYNLISANQKEDEPMNIGTVKNLIDTAIAKSQGGIRKLKRNISKKRTDNDGYVVLYEKDFT